MTKIVTPGDKEETICVGVIIKIDLSKDDDFKEICSFKLIQ